MSLHSTQPAAAGIYLHIPFCRQACVYCNFHFSTSLRYKDDVLRAMALEIELQRNYLGDTPVQTVYFGGGTPSLLTADEILRLFDAIQRTFRVDELKEVTLEANPDDLNIGYIRSLRSTPVNRFSIGIQSFRQPDLEYMKRAHNAQQAEAAIKGAQDVGFEKLSIDLIYGVPGMTDNHWRENLDKVRQLQIPHFSAYALTVEERTALHHAIAHNKAVPVDAAQAAGQFGILMDTARAMGYEHYEISNLALPRQYAIHNTNYWRGLPYLGIGPSAHSFDGLHRRAWNVSNNIVYTKAILEDNKPSREEEVLSPFDHLNEYIMTSLRTQWGCDLDHIARNWDETTATVVEKGSHLFQEKHWMVQDGRVLKLTDQGKYFADRIAGDMFLSGDDL
jgi:oxygen-independent coproporphyrinogen III oxidase